MTTALEALTDAVHEHIAGFDPQDGEELDAWLQQLPDAIHEIGNAFATLGSRLGSDFPVDSAVSDMITELSSTFASSGDLAGEVYTTHREKHEPEMKRYEEPRPNEEMWDVK